MPTESVKVPVASVEEYSKWKTLAEWRKRYSEEQVVEMLCRYCDAQRYAKAYRTRKAEKDRLIREQLRAIAAEKGVSVEELLRQRQPSE